MSRRFPANDRHSSGTCGAVREVGIYLTPQWSKLHEIETSVAQLHHYQLVCDILMLTNSDNNKHTPIEMLVAMLRSTA